MTLEEKHSIFMVKARCCYSKKTCIIAEKKQLGTNVRIEDLYQLKMLYLLTSAFKNYDVNCIAAEDYDKIYNMITDMCKFCNCSETITS